MLYRVDAGGPAIQSSDTGPDWAADTDAAPSSLHNAGSSTSQSGPIANVASTVPSYVPKAIFNTERWDPGSNGDGGEMTWTFPVPATDNLTLNLFFSNRYSGTSQVGQREFDVTVDDQEVLSKYDIVADVGDQTGTMKSFPVPAGSSTLTITFSHEVENPLIDGIEVIDSSQPAAPPQSLDGFSANSFDPSTGAGSSAAVQPSNGGGIAWGSVRGAFVLNGRIWYGMSDGNFYYRTWDGANAFGPAMLVDPYNDPYWDKYQTGSGQTYQGTATSFYGEIPNVTGMFYANRSIYYTLYGDGRLYRRDFSPDTATSSIASQVTGGIISPVENVVTSPNPGTAPDFSDATGMFVANGTLWFSRKDGKLYQAGWNGSTVTSDATVDANASGTNWSGRGLFLSPGGSTPPPPQQPVASFNSSCSNLACSFNGSASTAPGSSITSYSWTFGDGGTATGATPNHTYLAGNNYSVSLTVTNAANATNTSTQQITVSAGPPPPPGTITPVGAAAANGNGTSETVTTPAVQAGNGMLLIATAANGSTLTAPAGWTKVDTATSSAVTTTVWQKVATATDHGTAVKVTFSTTVHGTVQLLAYAGTNATNPVVAYQKKITSGSATTYVTPTAAVPANGDVVVSYWTTKSSAVTSWTAPSGQQVRSAANGSGGGHVNSLATDGGSANAGTAGGLTATTDTAGSAFTAWTIVLG